MNDLAKLIRILSEITQYAEHNDDGTVSIPEELIDEAEEYIADVQARIAEKRTLRG